MSASPTTNVLLVNASRDNRGEGACRGGCAPMSPSRADLQAVLGDAVPLSVLYEQLPLPGLSSIRTRPRCDRPKQPGASPLAGKDRLLAAYLTRLTARGVAQEGFLAYRYQLRSALHVAAKLAGRVVTYEELFRDPHLFGRVLVDDVAPSAGTRLSRWTLAQRRSAIRSFASLMRPELLALLHRDPHSVLDESLRSVAERVGGGYRLTGGVPRRRGGYVPTREQLAEVLDAVARDAGWVGARNRVYFSILLATGARVNALRLLDGSDCFEMQSGRLRLFVHEKGKAEPREVELDRELADGLREYAAEFNRGALVRGWHARVHLGEPGPVWRNSGRGRWQYQDVASTLKAACVVANAPPFTPHALRRAFATDATSVLPRHVVAMAGGWKGLERLDDHYIHPRLSTIWGKLTQGDPQDIVETAVDTVWRTSDEATATLR